uniref:LON2 n=1 Tax=Arundo donax TaxID=35708 RepID=A0A0A9DUY1_ARUDO
MLTFLITILMSLLTYPRFCLFALRMSLRRYQALYWTGWKLLPLPVI